MMNCDNSTKMVMEFEEHDEDIEECPEQEICTIPTEENNVAFSLGITIAAGSATIIGALLSFLPCFKRSNVTLLAVGLALAAGLLVYLAFIEILEESGNYFCCQTKEHYTLAANGCFFLGILLTLLLEYFLDSVQKLDVGCACSLPWSKRKSKIDKKLGDQLQRQMKSSSLMKHLKTKLTGKSPPPQTVLSIPNITVESEKTDETTFDVTAESDIVVVTTENPQLDVSSCNDCNTVSLCYYMWFCIVYINLFFLRNVMKLLQWIQRSTKMSWTYLAKMPKTCTEWACSQVIP